MSEMDERKKGIAKFLGLALYTPVLFFYYYVSKKYDLIYNNVSYSSTTCEAFLNLKRYGSFYFTGWNFSAQVYFLVVAILDESSFLVGIPQNVKKTLRLIRHYLFTAIVFPCTMVVSGLFWFLYFFDRELVFPSSLDEFYPPWMTHSVHSFILFPVIVEINIPKEHGFEVVKFYYALPVLTAFVVVYQISLIAIYFCYDVWLYPIFRHLTWTQRIFFLILVYVAAVILLYLGIYVQHLRRKVRFVKIDNSIE